MARQVFDDFENKQPQTQNDKLIAVRETFDEYNLISALHSYFSSIIPNLKTCYLHLYCFQKKKTRVII